MQNARKAPLAEKDEEQTEEKEVDGEKAGKKADEKDADVEEIKVDGIIDTDGGPEDVQKMLNAVLKSVKNVIDSVDDEVQGE